MAAVSLKRVFNYYMKKYSLVIDEDLKKIKKLLKSNGLKATFEFTKPDYVDFKKLYEWGEDRGNDFYIKVKIKKSLTEVSKLSPKLKLTKKIDDILDRSKESEAYLGQVYIVGYGDNTSEFTFSFYLNKAKDFDIEKIKKKLSGEVEKTKQKKEEKVLKNYTEIKALQLAIDELLILVSVKGDNSVKDTNMIAEKFGLDPKVVRKEFDKKYFEKKIEQVSQNLFDNLVNHKINPHVDKKKYKTKLEAFSTRVNVGDQKKFKKYFEKKYLKKFKKQTEIEKQDKYTNLSSDIDRFFNKNKVSLEKKRKLKGIWKQKAVNYAEKSGVDPDELIEFYEKEFLSDQIKEDNELIKFKNNIISTTLSRLPRFIFKVVKDVPIKLKRKKGKKKGGPVAYYKNRKILLYLSSGRDLANFVLNLAHEYWHAFEDKSGFKFKSKDIFNKMVDEIKFGNFSKNAIEDFEKVVELIFTYTRNAEFKKRLKEFKRAWTRDDQSYFKGSTYLRFVEEVNRSVDKNEFYESLSEILAETCGHIAAGSSGKALSPSLVVWMNKKFSSKSETIVKFSEEIIKNIVRGE